MSIMGISGIRKKPKTNLDDGLEIEIGLFLKRLCMYAQDLESALIVRERDLNLAIEAAGTEEGGVERVRSVGGHDDLCLAEGGEAVHLVQKLHQRPLDLAVGRGAL